MTTRTDSKRPPLAEPRDDLEMDLSASLEFLALPLEERRKRLDEVSKFFQEALAGTTVDDLIAEKRREVANEG